MRVRPGEGRRIEYRLLVVRSCRARVANDEEIVELQAAHNTVRMDDVGPQYPLNRALRGNENHLRDEFGDFAGECLGGRDVVSRGPADGVSKGRVFAQCRFEGSREDNQRVAQIDRDRLFRADGRRQ